MEITKETLKQAITQAIDEITSVPGLKEETTIVVGLVGMSIGSKVEEFLFGKEENPDV